MNLIKHPDQVFGVALSPDGHQLATACGDKTVRLWNADTGELMLGRLDRPHRLGLAGVVFSPDGQWAGHRWRR